MSTQENVSFEQAFTQLGEKVQALEAGGLTLEEATRLFEESMRLAQLCNRILSEAELKITRLTDVHNSSVEESTSESEGK